jgi:hypothetical protein
MHLLWAPCVSHLHPPISCNKLDPPNLDPIHPLIHLSLSLSLSLSYPFTNLPNKYVVYSMLDQGGRDGQISLVGIGCDHIDCSQVVVLFVSEGLV